MKRIELFEIALIKTEETFKKFPNFFVLSSAIDQLKYLLDMENKNIRDLSILKKMTIGQIAARDVDSLDANLADLLHKVSGEIRKMQLDFS